MGNQPHRHDNHISRAACSKDSGSGMNWHLVVVDSDRHATRSSFRQKSSLLLPLSMLSSATQQQDEIRRRE